MKIALVTPYDYPYPGGVTEHIRHLDREFRARGHETRIIAPSTQEQEALDTNVIKVSGDVLPVPFNGSIARVALSPEIWERVEEILNDEQFDVVHVHEPEAPLVNWAVLQMSRAVNVGTFHAYSENKTAYQYIQPFLEWVWMELDGRIFVSPALRDALAPYLFGESRVIPNGIDYSRFAGRDPSPSSGQAPSAGSGQAVAPIAEFDDGRPNILFVGRLEPRKGFPHLLNAYPQIKRALPGARLLVVGAFGEAEKARLAEQLRANELRDVHLIGRVSNEDLPRYYRTATVFCAPSTGGESFGIVLLEAMAAGVPVVASGIAGYRSVMQDGVQGRLVAPGDEPALAEAIIGLLRDVEACAQMATRGRETAAQYDWSVVAPKVLEFYRELLETRPRWRAAPKDVPTRQMERGVTVPETARVVMEIRGHLKLEGWDQHEVFASARGGGEVHVEMHESTVSVMGMTNGKEYTVYVPRGATAHITRVDGHAWVRGLSHALEIERVAGHLKLEQIAAASIRRVAGNLTAYEIQGELECKNVAGNLTVHMMAGHLTAHAAGNASIHSLYGAITLDASGKAQVALSPQPSQTSDGASSIRADKIELTLDPSADATVTIQDQRGVRTRVFGNGQIPIALEARGVVVNKASAPIMKMTTAGTA
jgi:phosphatidylinositol alpha-mannosyltransferase